MHWFYGRFIRTRRNEQYLQENDILERWIEFLLLDTFFNFCFSVCHGSCVQLYPSQWRQLRSYKSQLSTYTWFFMTWEQNCNFSNQSQRQQT
jgi:hypothetical protein